MSTARDIFQFINSIAPFDTQESWDNSGLLIGSEDKEVSKAAVGLDVTNATIDMAAEFGADLFVSHHPVIFNAIKTVLSDSVAANAVKNDITVISAHTCWDAAQGGVNDVLARILGLHDVTPILPNAGGIAMLRRGTLKVPVPAEDFAEIVASALDTVVRVSSPEKLIQKVAVCGGAGASLLPDLAGEDIDAYVTGDAKHNDFLDAADMGISLLAAGHYETETVSMPVLMALLKKEFPDIEFKYIKNPPVKYIG